MIPPGVLSKFNSIYARYTEHTQNTHRTQNAYNCINFFIDNTILYMFLNSMDYTLQEVSLSVQVVAIAVEEVK